jgi:hypothetical protein
MKGRRHWKRLTYGSRALAWLIALVCLGAAVCYPGQAVMALGIVAQLTPRPTPLSRTPVPQTPCPPTSTPLPPPAPAAPTPTPTATLWVGLPVTGRMLTGMASLPLILLGLTAASVGFVYVLVHWQKRTTRNLTCSGWVRDPPADHGSAGSIALDGSVQGRDILSYTKAKQS